jgi:hypothetical protein
MLMAFLLQQPNGAADVLDELHAFAKRLSLGAAGQRMLNQLTNPD